MLAQRLSHHLNRRSVEYLVIFSAIYFARAGAEAVTRPLWHDELFTAYLSQVPTLGGLWDALSTGVDLVPPLYHLAVRLLASWFGDGPLVFRLPSIVGFWIMCLCLYRYTARQLPVEFGFAALLVPFSTSVSQYMTEARPYGLVLGLGGLALVSWQALAPRTAWRPMWLALIATSLAAAISSHYYAVLLLLPLAAGEALRSYRRGAADIPAWISIAAPLLILVPLLPLIRVAREFAPTFWTQPRIGETALVYNNWFAHGDWVLVALVAAAALVPWVARYSPAEPVSHPPLTDVVPPAIFLALPALGALTAYATSSGFMWRYVVPGIIGFAILASYCLARLFGHSPALRVAMVTVLALNQEAIFDTRALLNPEQSETTRIERRLSGLEGGPAPVVVTSPHKFLELYYYAPNELRSRLRYVASREVSVRELGSDTADRGLILLAKVVPLPVGIYPGDLPRTSYYVVDLEPLNWLVRELARAGTRIAVVVAGDGFLIARVPGSHDAE